MDASILDIALKKSKWKMNQYVQLNVKKIVQWSKWPKQLNLVKRMDVYQLVIQVH
ncbi:Uncharacterised protein [Mycobacteroides abscessus]|nr:Uncharacterised protein [Mycobacteroides abscessus]